MTILEDYHRRVKSHLNDVITIKKTPHSIALGISTGFFLGSLPIPGASIFLAVLIVIIYPRISKIALATVLIIWGFASAGPIYLLSLRIGEYLLDQTPIVEYELSLLDSAYHLTKRFLLGFITLNMSCSVMIYILSRTILEMKRIKTTD